MSRRELAVYVLVMYGLFAAIVAAFDDYGRRIEHTGDNLSYAYESAAVRGHAPPAPVAQHFLGYPLVTAGAAALFRVSDWSALVIVSVVASLAAVWLAAELWGAVIAAWFAVLNLDWVQRSLLGGAEPLFVVLVFAALAAARRERWLLSAAFGALATIVRPLGVFLLLALGIELLRRRRIGVAAAATAIALGAGAAYLAVVRALFHDPFGNFRFYGQWGLGRDRTFIPYVTLALSYRDGLVTARNVAKTLAWTTLTIAGVVAAIRRRCAGEHPMEWLFGAIYLASFFFFPAWWIEGEYSRYLAPVIPMLFAALRPWVPSNRIVLWIVGALAVTLAAVKDIV